MQLSRRSLIGILMAGSVFAACGSGSDSASPAKAEAAATTTEAATPAAAVTLIDVRTPEEYAAGHLTGAVNYSLEDGSLEAMLASLDPSARYQVYCRTGRRSALAAQLMAERGFTAVEDLGAMDAAALRTGLAVVTG